MTSPALQQKQCQSITIFLLYLRAERVQLCDRFLFSMTRTLLEMPSTLMDLQNVFVFVHLSEMLALRSRFVY